MTSTAGAEDLYPLLLEPRLSEKMWGGHRLAQFVNKTLPPDKRIGESWEAWDGCVIANGAHQGKTLRALLQEQREDILGTAADQTHFPLLFKYIDAQDDLSLQVHPDDRFARMLEAQACGKTEAWYIIHVEPGACLAHGFNRDIDAPTLQTYLAQNKVEELLAFVPVRRGDVLFVPAGTVHAIGKGIVLAEIQQNSDTTYRLHDWGRVDESGRGRELHVDRSMQVCEYTGLSEHTVPMMTLQHSGFDQHYLVACRYFALERLDIHERIEASPLKGKFQILSVLEGEAQILSGPAFERSIRAPQGQTVLLPARLGAYTITPMQQPLQILRAYVPALREEVIEPLMKVGYDPQRILKLGGSALKHNDLWSLLQTDVKTQGGNVR